MTPERFWELVGTLGGVADDASCARLDALLRETGEGPAFADVLEEQVDPLVSRCAWPADLARSDARYWVAAAVVAAGEEARGSVLASGALDPDQWQWAEAEALLVAGVPDDADDASDGPANDGAPIPPVDVALQWLAFPVPEGVDGPGEGDLIAAIDLGDDPSWGRRPVHDPDWLAAQDVLAADDAFLDRRARLAGLQLCLTVRPAPAPDQPAPDPSTHSPFGGFRPVSEAAAHRFPAEGGEAVVLTVPVTDFPPAGSRVESYVRAVHQLVEAAEV